MHVLRDWLKISGWSNAFIEAHITLQEGSHITRTRWTHQVTAASLNVQQRATYRQYLDIHLAVYILWVMHNTVSSCSDVLVVYEIYECNQFPTVFRDAQKVGIVIVSQYSSWMPVHNTQLFQLKYTHPSVYHQFLQGHFTVQTTRHIFSSETLDQKHEQLNEVCIALFQLLQIVG